MTEFEHYAAVRWKLAWDFAARRKVCGLSQRATGDLVRSAGATVARLECPDDTVNLRTMCRIAYALGCDVEVSLIVRVPAETFGQTRPRNRDVPGQKLLPAGEDS